MSISLTTSSRMSKSFAIVAAFILFLAFFVTSGDGAVRRSVRQSSGNEVEDCRTNGICGWQIYNASTRVHQRYVPTTCRCNKKDICARAEDDIGIPAYVYRCRDSSSRRRTTVRPATSDNTAGQS